MTQQFELRLNRFEFCMFFQNVVKTEQSLFTFRISAALTHGRIATAGNGKQFDPSAVSPPPVSKDSHNSCSFTPSCSSCNEFGRKIQLYWSVWKQHTTKRTWKCNTAQQRNKHFGTGGGGGGGKKNTLSGVSASSH